VAGTHNGSPDVALVRIDKGYRFTTLGSDAWPLAAGSHLLLSRMRPAA
jgi:4-hydroxy-2-oxoheptanedioate aldolase